ncbi:MAG TPA: WD40 repeat domain-containing protein, partial [Nannocystis sp.]
LLLTTSSDGTARLWRPRGDGHISLVLPQRGTATPGEPDHTLWTGSFSPDGRHVLTAGADGLGRVFPVDLAAQVEEACARAGRNFDPATWKQLVGERPYQPTCPDPE